jgi:hypothetical protein
VVAARHKISVGLTIRTFATGSNKVLASIPPPKEQIGKGEGEIDYGVQLGQHKLERIFLSHALKED